MKKIIFAFCFLFMMTQSITFADEIIDAKGSIIPCRIETVEQGLIEYYKDGNLYMFTRQEASPVFNDYIDVRSSLIKKDDIKRISGRIKIKDMWGTMIDTEDGQITIPFYKIKFIGIYKP